MGPKTCSWQPFDEAFAPRVNAGLSIAMVDLGEAPSTGADRRRALAVAAVLVLGVLSGHSADLASAREPRIRSSRS